MCLHKWTSHVLPRSVCFLKIPFMEHYFHGLKIECILWGQPIVDIVDFLFRPLVSQPSPKYQLLPDTSSSSLMLMNYLHSHPANTIRFWYLHFKRIATDYENYQWWSTDVILTGRLDMALNDSEALPLSGCICWVCCGKDTSQGRLDWRYWTAVTKKSMQS